jgi:SagB-type dehydrogenase family enzyme
MPKVWNQLAYPHREDDCVWETFHEVSKTSRVDAPPSTGEVLARMGLLWESLPYSGYPIVELPHSLSLLHGSLADAVAQRQTARDIRPASLSLDQVAALLECAYGVTRSNEGTVFPRPFRTVPSGGGLYPLELYFHSAHVQGLQAGLYHYNAAEHRLRLLHGRDETRQLSESLVQRNLATDCALIVFITAIFERNVFKYGERGYRFTLLEAGHVAQNLNLAATSLGLGSVNIGGFFDRSIDALLDFDGCTQSTIYLVGIGATENGAGGGEQ